MLVLATIRYLVSFLIFWEVFFSNYLHSSEISKETHFFRKINVINLFLEELGYFWQFSCWLAHCAPPGSDWVNGNSNHHHQMYPARCCLLLSFSPEARCKNYYCSIFAINMTSLFSNISKDVMSFLTHSAIFRVDLHHVPTFFIEFKNARI